MEALFSLPKALAIWVALKILLAIVLVISLGLSLVGGVSFYLSFQNYPMSTVLLGGLCAWLFFLLILLFLLLLSSHKVKQKKERLEHVVQTELLATLALRSLNLLIHKWQKHHKD